MWVSEAEDVCIGLLVVRVEHRRLLLLCLEGARGFCVLGTPANAHKCMCTHMHLYSHICMYMHTHASMCTGIDIVAGGGWKLLVKQATHPISKRRNDATTRKGKETRKANERGEQRPESMPSSSLRMVDKTRCCTPPASAPSLPPSRERRPTIASVNQTHMHPKTDRGKDTLSRDKPLQPPSA